jgi:hypothetical protein
VNRKARASEDSNESGKSLQSSGDVFVVAKPFFNVRPGIIGVNQVRVPNYLFKLVYEPGAGKRGRIGLRIRMKQGQENRLVTLNYDRIDFVTGLRQ